MDPNRNEYLGAAAGMAETYGTQLPPIGSEVTFRLQGLPGCHWEKGILVGVNDGTLVVNVHDRAAGADVDVKFVSLDDLLPF